MKLHPHLLAVEIAFKIQDEALDRNSAVVVLDCGTYSYIGNGGAALAIEPRPGGVDAEGRDNHALGYAQVDGGEAQSGVANALAVAHLLG